MVVSRGRLLDRNWKLVQMTALQPGPLPPVGSGTNAKTFWATVLSRLLGIMLPGKAVRQGWPPTIVVVAGSKIWPCRTGVPSHGLVTPRGGPSKAEKSPARFAAGGRGVCVTVPALLRYCFPEKKENNLSWPLYNLGIQTGPPRLPPKSC